MEQKTPFQPSEACLDAVAGFCLRLFAACRDSQAVNRCLSPLSAWLALVMAANGGDTVTLAQLEALLGGILSSLNETSRALLQELSLEEGDDRVAFASSAWFREDGFTISESFLQDIAACCKAQAYPSDFRRREAASEAMNRWIRRHTGGRIQEIIRPEELDDALMMVLYNTAFFQMAWAEPIPDKAVYDEIFTTAQGQRQLLPFFHAPADFLQSEGLYQGFRKAYSQRYAFVGLFPAGGMTPEELAASLDAAALRGLADAGYREAKAAFPVLRMEQTLDLKEALEALGLKNFFAGAGADLSRMGRKEGGRLEVGRILQKTYLEVSQQGTTAAAATRMDIALCALFPPSEPVPVILNRPFLFLIQDTATGLPLFMGAINAIS